MKKVHRTDYVRDDFNYRKPIIRALLATLFLLLFIVLFFSIPIQKGAVSSVMQHAYTNGLQTIRIIEGYFSFYADKEGDLTLFQREALEAAAQVSSRQKVSLWVFDGKNGVDLLNSFLDHPNSDNNRDFIKENKAFIISALNKKPVVHQKFLRKEGVEDIEVLASFKMYKPWGWIIGTDLPVRNLQPVLRQVNRRVFVGFLINICTALVILGFITLQTYMEAHKLNDANKKWKHYQQDLELVLDNRTRELEKTKKQFIEAEKLSLLGKMVASFTHDINTPIGLCHTVVSDMSYKNRELLEGVKNQNIGKADFISRMENMGEAISILASNIDLALEQVTGFKQIAVDQVTSESREIHLKMFLEEIFKGMKPQLKKGHHTLVIDCSLDCVIRSNPGALSQILINLIINSVKHGFKGLKNREIVIRAEERGERVNILYCDNGHGISNEVFVHLCEPFYSTDKSNGGTGLGMYNIVNLTRDVLGGHLVYSSEEGRGFFLQLYLPSELPGF